MSTERQEGTIAEAVYELMRNFEQALTMKESCRISDDHSSELNHQDQTRERREGGKMPVIAPSKMTPNVAVATD